MSILIGLGLFFLGGFIGVAVMCVVQIGSLADKKIVDTYSEQAKLGKGNLEEEHLIQ
ncbi:DUF3789 domain-containing protein [Enterococcus sp. DIV0756]|uniref:DUF3789 domain-containing protein n=1 Tax=Enterococcus sp. DIV0756 TaxID=2774636 RepID=UPI003F20D962